MTADEFRTIRRDAGLSIRDLAATLRYNDDRGLRRMEEGEKPISGIVAFTMELIRDGHVPVDLYRQAEPRR